MRPGYEPPTLQVTRFRALPTANLAPRFELGLHIINPNRTPLQIDGISYQVRIEGETILSGVRSNLPQIGGYQEQELTVEVTADLINSMRLISELARQPKDNFTYEVTARLDVGFLLPDIKVSKEGTISLRALIR